MSVPLPPPVHNMMDPALCAQFPIRSRPSSAPNPRRRIWHPHRLGCRPTRFRWVHVVQFAVLVGFILRCILGLVSGRAIFVGCMQPIEDFPTTLVLVVIVLSICGAWPTAPNNSGRRWVVPLLPARPGGVTHPSTCPPHLVSILRRILSVALSCCARLCIGRCTIPPPL